MELRQLRYFVGVAEAGSLLRASAVLHIAQPALGLQISALEDEMGVRLFERTSRGMRLTEPGRIFLDHAKVVLADVERARAAVSTSASELRGEVVIGLPTTAALAATVPIVRACRERLPQVRLKIIEAYSGFVREWLMSGRLDLAILYGDAPVATLALQPLVEERLALITAADGRVRPAKVTLRQVARHALVLPGRDHGLRRIIDDACAALGLSLEVAAEIDSLPNVKRAVESGIGSTILPAGAVAEEVAAGRLAASTIKDATMLRRVMLARSVTRPATSAASAVAALTVDLIRDMVASGSWPGRWIGSEGPTSSTRGA